MATTKDLDIEKRLRELFEGKLLPVSESMKASGSRMLDSGFNPGALTYYTFRKKRSMSASDFDWGGCVNPGDLALQLSELWHSKGEALLAGLAPEIGGLAEACRQVEAAPEDVSPFIYVMY